MYVLVEHIILNAAVARRSTMAAPTAPPPAPALPPVPAPAAMWSQTYTTVHMTIRGPLSAHPRCTHDAHRLDFERLDLSTNPFLEKTFELMSDRNIWVEDAKRKARGVAAAVTMPKFICCFQSSMAEDTIDPISLTRRRSLGQLPVTQAG